MGLIVGHLRNFGHGKISLSWEMIRFFHSSFSTLSADDEFLGAREESEMWVTRSFMKITSQQAHRQQG